MGRRVLDVVVTVLAVAAGVVSSFYVFGADGYSPVDKEPHPSVLSSLAFGAALGAAVMLVWRHRVLWAGGALVYLATALALWRDMGWHKEVTIAGELFAITMPAKLISVLVMAALLTAIPLTVGILRGTRADLRRREASERELRDEVTRQEERSRIAHEMHDVLGHRLSLLSLQAGALEVSPTAAPEVARTVRTTARQSLADLRQVIGVLRDGRDFQLAGGPAPALVDLPALVASTREAGVPVNLTPRSPLRCTSARQP